MNKDVLFAAQYVTYFLHDFNQPLMNLPVEIREQHVLEIKSDLYEHTSSIYQILLKYSDHSTTIDMKKTCSHRCTSSLYYFSATCTSFT
ncbi:MULTISPECIES: hypothetical protein [Bacillus]|uniref:hypothetical protein n=1 Tax=Bacillus TaxID=1386 RepID=UPI0011157CE2|nr:MULTISPECIES: hypothetical protein [Bacillus cereus group]MDF2083574.1 hypothetical protein [Bacillus pseudomycoides]